MNNSTRRKDEHGIERYPWGQATADGLKKIRRRPLELLFKLVAVVIFVLAWFLLIRSLIIR
ncbi:MAG: hypothetical protein M3Q73_04340 [bacterium]|nr:hypothetical protein [bacterium]